MHTATHTLLRVASTVFEFDGHRGSEDSIGVFIDGLSVHIVKGAMRAPVFSFLLRSGTFVARRGFGAHVGELYGGTGERSVV